KPLFRVGIGWLESQGFFGGVVHCLRRVVPGVLLAFGPCFSLVGVAVMKAVSTSARQVLPRRVVPLIQIDHHTHRRLGVGRIANVPIPAVSVHPPGTTSTSLRTA